jgi:DNA-binding response OmpR family regulator
LVLSEDAKTNQRIAALMQRVLIVDPQPPSAKLLSGVLRDISNCQIWTAADETRGMIAAQGIEPHLIFVDHGPGLDGASLTRQIRRSELMCRKSPVIMFSSMATAAAIIGARDAGVHEFLRKPYTIKDLLRRLEAVSSRPRDWIEGIGYVGPDRRRFNSGDYSGPLKRRVDHAETPDEARFVQALKILKAALAAMDADPKQALRCLIAQADVLGGCIKAKSDMDLKAAAVALGQRLAFADAKQLPKAEIEYLCRPLLAFLPHDDVGARPAA